MNTLATHQPLTVLLFDDDPLMAAFINGWLPEGVRLQVVTTANHAQEWLTQHPVALLIGSDGLADHQGRKLLKELQRQQPECQLLLCGYRRPGDHPEWAEGRCPLLTKPFDPVTLKETLDQALRTYRLGMAERVFDASLSRLPRWGGSGYWRRIGQTLPFYWTLYISATLATIVALQGLFLLTGGAIFLLLYLLKQLFGLDLLDSLHLQDLL